MADCVKDCNCLVAEIAIHKYHEFSPTHPPGHTLVGSVGYVLNIQPSIGE